MPKQTKKFSAKSKYILNPLGLGEVGALRAKTYAYIYDKEERSKKIQGFPEVPIK